MADDDLEQRIREPHRQNALHGFLAKKVIDSENLVFAKHIVQLCIERDRTRKVGAEGLFHDHPRPLDEPCIAQEPHRGQRGIRRNA